MQEDMTCLEMKLYPDICM